MGLFDSFIKTIVDGDIDKKLEQIATTVEKFSEKMEQTAKVAVDKSEDAVKKVDTVRASTAKAMDAIKK